MYYPSASHHRMWRSEPKMNLKCNLLNTRCCWKFNPDSHLNEWHYSSDSTFRMTGSLTNAEIKARIAASYNQIAQKYLDGSTPHRNDSISFLQKYIIPHLNSVSDSYTAREQELGSRRQGVAALELGCGAGIPTTQLLASVRNIHITANDISSKQISLARQNLVSLSHSSSSISLMKGDMMKLSFPRSKFDAVVAMYSIFHLPRPEQTAAEEQ